MTELDGENPAAPRSESPRNVPEYSVSEIAGALKRSVEDAFGRVRVRGEAGRVKVYGSGHAYLTLKDENAVLEAVCFKATWSRLKFKPTDGLEVICSGKLTTYASRSQYQLIVDHIEPAGVGALMALLEERRKKLAAEGLFDAARKRPLPHMPAVIGVVTSLGGAVIRDILHRLRDRCPCHVLVWPVTVQGERAAGEVAAAIRGFNALPEGGAVPRPDVLIVARGGGSLEDLWAFNEEAVVRAAAESAIPLISAVGHETDTTLIDFASDRRAPTPTAAAEMAVPVLSELRYQVTDFERRLLGGLNRRMDGARRELRAAVRGLRDPHDLLQAAAQRLDDVSAQLDKCLIATVDNRRRDLREAVLHLKPALRRLVGEKRGEFREVAGRLRPALVSDRLAPARRDLVQLGRHLRRNIDAQLRREKDRLLAAGRLLDSFSYEAVLARGFALVRDTGSDAPLLGAASTAPGQAITLQFRDGRVAAHVDHADAAPPAPATKRAPGKAGNQGSLF